MTRGSKVEAEIYFHKVPLFETTVDLAKAGFFPGAAYQNLSYVNQCAVWDDSIAEFQKLILCDPQTSGGLLISIPEEYAGSLMDKFAKSGIKAAEIGKVLRTGNGKMIVKP
jgi:selenide, water dikinase